MSATSEAAVLATDRTYAGRFFDGRHAAARTVEVRLAATGLRITVSGDIGSDAATSHEWPYDAIRPVEPVRPGETVRLALVADEGARLIVEEDSFAVALRDRAPRLWRRGFRWRRLLPRIVLTSAAVAAVAAIFAAAVFWVPSVAARVIPDSWTAALGDRIAVQLAGIFSKGRPQWCDAADGKAALDRLVRRLRRGAGTERIFEVRVASAPAVNAFAIPGGRIVILSGLVDSSRSADELAGVLAHEMAHVIERHPTEAAIRALGVHAIFGAMFGSSDMLTGIGETALLLNFSRDAEREADSGAVALLDNAGIDASGMSQFFDRLAAMEKLAPDVLQFLSSHPRTDERAAATRRPSGTGEPAMTPAEWQAVKKICATASDS